MTEIKKIHSFDGVFDAQKLFRIILDAMSNPTRTINIKRFADKLYWDTSALLAVAMTLLDNEVSFHSCGSPSLSDEIISLTLSAQADIADADYIFVSDPSLLTYAVENAKCGTLRDPHRSATIIVNSNGQNNCRLSLRGPGIDGMVSLDTSELVITALDARDARCFEYPCGVDFIFLSGDDDLSAIPRLVRREVL